MYSCKAKMKLRKWNGIVVKCFWFTLDTRVLHLFWFLIQDQYINDSIMIICKYICWNSEIFTNVLLPLIFFLKFIWMTRYFKFIIYVMEADAKSCGKKIKNINRTKILLITSDTIPRNVQKSPPQNKEWENANSIYFSITKRKIYQGSHSLTGISWYIPIIKIEKK